MKEDKLNELAVFLDEQIDKLKSLIKKQKLWKVLEIKQQKQ